MSSITFVTGDECESDALLITVGSSVLIWKYVEPEARAMPLLYRHAEESIAHGEERKVAMARIVKLKGTSLLLVAEWSSLQHKPPKAKVMGFKQTNEGEYVSTDIVFENVVVFSEAGIAISRDGGHIAFCQHTSSEHQESTTVLNIIQLDAEGSKVLHRLDLTGQLLPQQQATSLDFSPCSSFLLLGFSHTQDGISEVPPVAFVFRTKDCQSLLIHRSADMRDNCSNGARFLVGSKSSSFMYGTVGGRVVLVGKADDEQTMA